MVTIPLTVQITLNGLAARIPAFGWLAGDYVSLKIARGLAKGVVAEFLTEGVQLARGVEVDVMATRIHDFQDGERQFEIDLRIRYAVTNHEELAIQKASGWRKLGLMVGKSWLRYLPEAVEAEIKQIMLARLRAKLPPQVEALFAQYGLTVSAVLL